MATPSYVTYNPNAGASAPVVSMGSGNAPNPVAIHILSSAEIALIQGNDPNSILVDTTTSPPSVIANANYWAQFGATWIARQINIVAQGYKAAISAPYAFTNSAGVASSYAMDSDSKFIYSNAYISYVLGAQPLPSGFTIRDVNNVPQAFTVADIKTFYLGAVDFFQTCNAAFNTLEANIKASTSLSQCQSYIWVTP